MSRTTLFGPPGTGKTTTLSRWAKSASEKHGGENILICSLTRTAASEIGSRDTDVPTHNIGTLHAHAYRSIEDGPKIMAREVVDQFNENFPQWALPQNKVDDDESKAVFGSSFLGKYDLLRARGIDKGAYPEFLTGFVEAYEMFKESHNVIDFTDMIQYAIDHVDCPVDYIMMDEAQDCSVLEFALLQKWAGQCKAAVIAGDDDQAAYEWRGASVSAFLGFAEDQRVLGQTYRLPERIKKRADTWIHQIRNRKPKEYLHKPGVAGVAVEVDFRKPEDVLGHALSQPGTSMVLTTCGYQTLPFVHRLKELAVPFCNPYRTRGDFASTWNPLTSGGKGATSVSDSIRSFLSPPWTWKSGRAWMKELTGLPRGTKKMLEDNKALEEMIPPDLILGWIGSAGLSAAISGDLDWLVQNLKTDPKRRSQILLRVRMAKRGGISALTEKPSIIVGTIHSVKGGQADNVYLIPDLSGMAKEEWVNGRTDPIVRQMYIGMTRASSRLFLCQPPRNAVLRW